MPSHTLQTLAPFFAPPQCEACEQGILSDQWLCEACQEKIKNLPSNHCRICAEPFSSTKTSEHLCGECLKYPPAFSKVWAAYLYEGAVPPLIQQAKLKKRPLGLINLARQSVGLFRQALEEFQPDLLLPVPLSFWRSFQRGYNQSYLLAKTWRKEWKNKNLKISRGGPACPPFSFMGRHIGLPLPIALVVNRRHTKALAQQKREERLKALRHAFRADASAVLKRRILVMDDVMTTGATVQALSLALKNSGAEEVGVCVLARTAKWG